MAWTVRYVQRAANKKKELTSLEIHPRKEYAVLKWCTPKAVLLWGCILVTKQSLAFWSCTAFKDISCFLLPENFSG